MLHVARKRRNTRAPSSAARCISSADCQAIIQDAVIQGNCSTQACPTVCKAKLLKAGWGEGTDAGRDWHPVEPAVFCGWFRC